jgi:hypothetical protein
MSDINYNLPYSFPRQKLARTKKDKEWGIQNVDFIIGLSNNHTLSAGYNSFQKKQVNYNLYNSIIDPEDFTYVTNPYGLKEEFPAKMYNYNIITPKLKLLEGEEIKRPFNFRIVAVNEDAVSEIEEKKKGLVLQYLEVELVKALQEQGISIQNPDTGEQQTPEQIQKYANYSLNDMRELTANRLAQYLIKQQNLEFKFNKGFKDSLITSEEFYYVGIENGEPIVEVINPLDYDYDKNPDKDFIEDGQWGSHTKYCTPSEVIDVYGSDLDEDDVASIDSGTTGGSGQTRLGEGPATGPLVPITYTRPAFDHTHRNGYVRVTRVEWKSMRRIGYLTSYDPQTLEKSETIVDETYVPVKENGETVEWIWISEVWEGTKIGNGIYTRIRPKTVQYRTIDNPSTCKLGFVGAVNNGRNSIPTSLIDLVKHHQYLYNIIMYRMELEIAKAKGKKMVMDIAQIPRSQGMDIDKWMYYFDTVGIAFINSFEEGKGKFQGQTSSFNQFAGIDMTLSQSIGQYISILEKIEDMAAELMGVTRQRLGAITSSETVGGVERSVTQSSHVTEPLFYLHNEVKKNVLTQLIECAKVAYPEGKKINYILDDMGRTILNLDERFINADYGVFVTNSAKEVKSLDDLKSLANQAISSGMITLKEATTIISSESISQVTKIVDQAEQRADQMKQQEQQHELQVQQEALQAEKDRQSELQDRLDQREVLKGNIQKEVAAINAVGYAKDTDVNDNGVPDVFETQKLAADMVKHADNFNLDKQKLELEKQKLLANTKIAQDKNAVDKYKADKMASKRPASK